MITEEKKVAIAKRLASLPQDKQQQLSQRLAEEGIDVWQLPIVASGPQVTQKPENPGQPTQPDFAPLSFAQQRLWFIDQLAKDQDTHTDATLQAQTRAAYNLFFGLQFLGELNIEWLTLAFNQVVKRHDILRMQMCDVEGVGMQTPRPYSPVNMRVIDISDAQNPDAELAQLAQKQSETPFDLTQDELYRFWLVKRNNQHFVALFTVHHIVFDAWSVDNLIRELAQVYHTLAADLPLALPALSIQYQDFARWQRRWQSSPQYQTQLAYWQQQLQGAPQALHLAIEREPQALSSKGAGAGNGQEVSITLPAALSARLYGLSQSQNTTLYVTLLAAFNLLLQRYSGESDVCVGTSIANRPRLETEALLGYFVNTLVMRNQLNEQDRFVDFLQQVSQVATQAFQHQDLPFDHLLEQLHVKRENARSPLFQIMFVMNNAAGNVALQLPGVTLSSYEKPLTQARFDLTLRVTELKAQGQLRFDLEFNTALFADADIQGLLAHYHTLLSQISESPTLTLQQFSLLTPTQTQAVWESAHRMLLEPNPLTEANQPTCSAHDAHAQAVHQLFEMQVAKQPNRVALWCDDRALSYAQLNAEANRLARYLRKRGVTQEARVALLMARSFHFVVAVLGVLKAGGCYVPLDHTWPKSRLDSVLKNADIALVLTETQIQHQQQPRTNVVSLFAEKSHPVPVVNLNNLADELARYDAANPHFAVQPQHAAYCIYTSGSTGEPKGVVVEHRQIMGYVQGVMARVCKLTLTTAQEADSNTALQFASVSTLAADLGNTSIYGALCMGGVLHLISEDLAFDADAVATYMAQHQVEVLKIVPTHLRGLLTALAPLGEARQQAILPSKVLILGGEASALDWVAQVQALAPDLHIVNHYGPTETTVGALTYSLPSGSALHEPLQDAHLPAQTLPIGLPLPGYCALVLDANQCPVPDGLPGELYIGGVGVSRGYHQQAALTASRFVTLPLSEHANKHRFYRTGDKVKQLKSGEILFLGRLDDQVKIRGHRVELGEIEALLPTLEGVQNAAVVYVPAQQALVAFVVMAASQQAVSQQAAEATSIQAHLLAQLAHLLPDYMQPKALCVLPALPVTANGKRDKQALLQQAGQALLSALAPTTDTASIRATLTGHTTEKRAPQTAVQHALKQVWCEVLKREDFGIDDRFFDVGGDSILSLQVIAKAKKAGIKLTPKQLFNHPSIAELSELATWLPKVAATENQIVAAPKDAVIPLSYSQQRLWFLDQLHGPSSLYNMPMAVQIEGELNTFALEQSFADLVARHSALRTHFEAEKGVPKQVVDAPEVFSVQWQDFTCAESLVDAQHAVQAFARQAFDISQPGLFKVCVLMLSNQRHWLLVNCHHMVADGWSLGLLMQEFCQRYAQWEASQTPPSTPLPALPINYGDYAYWQQKSGQAYYQKQWEYWSKQLHQAPALLALPTDYPRPKQQGYQGAHLSVCIEPELAWQLKQLSRQLDCTLHTLMLAAWQVLLHRYSGQDDICVGSPIANRHLPETQGVVGFFANTSVLRANTGGNPSFTEFVKQVQQVSLEAQWHQDVPFEQLVEGLNVQRDTAYSPLFQVLFAWGVTQTQVQTQIQTSNGHLRLGHVPNSQDWLGTGTAKFDIELALREQPAVASQTHSIEQEAGQNQASKHTKNLGIEGRLEYASELFKPSSMARLWQHYVQLLSGFVAQPQAGIDSIALTLAEEKSVYQRLNDTQQDFSHITSFDDLFLAQVAQRGEAIAARFGSSSLSYAALNQQVNLLATALVKQGANAKDTVIVSQARGLPMLVSLLAIMRIGAVYVPIDPHYPPTRVRFMLEDANAKWVLTDSKASLTGLSALSSKAHSQQTWLDVTAILASSEARSDTELLAPDALLSPSLRHLKAKVTPQDLAYLIYTSGSTGKPKAVQVSRRNLCHFLCAMQALLLPTAADNLLAVTSLSFDIAALELYLPLICGAQVVIAPESMALDGRALKDAITNQAITFMQATPVSWKMLLAAGWQQTTPMTVLCGGEAFPPELAQQLVSQPELTVWNMYGPTETTVWSSAHCLSAKRASARVPDAHEASTDAPISVPIGRPIANTQMYVLDAANQLAPLGVAGELCIGGEGVSLGYLGLPTLTASRFVNTDFGRVYRTGDLARLREDGVLECLGRCDQQVKVRGYRIELGEVEAALLQDPQIRDAVVSVQPVQGESILVAHVVLTKPDGLQALPSFGAVQESAEQEGAVQESAEQAISEQESLLQKRLTQHCRSKLQELLPDYMVPQSIMALDALPLTPNGKVDKKALPLVTFAPSDKAYVAPSNHIEAQLCEIWQSLLGVERVGIDDNFFELGGHSLLAARLRAEIDAQMGKEVSLMQMFSHQTIASLAELIAKMDTQFEQDDMDWMASLMDSMEEDLGAFVTQVEDKG